MMASQPKRWSPSNYQAEFIEAWQIIGHEIRLMLSEQANKFLARKAAQNEDRNDAAKCESACSGATSQLASPQWPTTDSLEQDKEDEQDTPLAYGISVFAKLMSAISFYLHAFILDARIGLLPSRTFALTAYLILLAGLCFGSMVTQTILEPTLVNVLPGLVRNITRLLSISVVASQLGSVIHALTTSFIIVWRRRAIHQFILYRCSIIKLPRVYLRRTAVRLFITFLVISNCADPLFVSISLINDPTQPQVLDRFGPGWFSLLRPLSLAFITLCASSLSLCIMSVPMLSCYLIMCTARHLDCLLRKQMAHFKRFAKSQPLTTAFARLRRNENPHLARLLDDKTRHMIAQYSCDTLTLDWPQLEVDNDSDYSDNLDDSVDPDNSVDSDDSANPHHEDNKVVGQSDVGAKIWQPLVYGSKQLLARLAVRQRSSSRATETCLMADGCTNNSTNYESAAAGLLFMYKNLIKSLSELKGMIATYENNFGSFHIAMICIQSLSLAQWVTTALTEARLFRELRNQASVANNNTTTTMAVDQHATTLTPFGFRVLLSALMFVISNSYVFLRSDCLSDAIVKMRSRLFRLNIELAIAALKSQQLEAKKRKKKEKFSLSASQVDLPLASMQASTNSGQELDQIWSLYDQMVRISEMTNFKLTPGSHYSKRCLLWIFGRTVSLTLLCIQVIDIYSYT